MVHWWKIMNPTILCFWVRLQVVEQWTQKALLSVSEALFSCSTMFESHQGHPSLKMKLWWDEIRTLFHASFNLSHKLESLYRVLPGFSEFLESSNTLQCCKQLHLFTTQRLMDWLGFHPPFIEISIEEKWPQPSERLTVLRYWLLNQLTYLGCLFPNEAHR